MGRPYSNDLRERIVRAVEEEGLSRRQAADRYGVGVSTAIRLVKLFRETGGVAPGKMGGNRPKKLSGPWREWMIERRQGEDFTLRGLVDELGELGLKKAVRAVIRAAGARLFFLPKYSPDLNLIEQFFAKLKHWLRKAAGRTTDAVHEAIGPVLDRVTSDECANYFAHAGYAPA